MIQSTISRSLQRSSRPLLRSATSSLRPTIQRNTICPHTLSSRSLFTNTRPSAGRKFQSFLGRLGLAAAIVYWYNTSTIFAEEPAEKQPFISRAPPVEPIPEERFPTIDEVVAEKKAKAKAAASDTINQTVVVAAGELETGSKSPESLEEEAGQQGAFNEETGEINWDCPCLGGMAHGPCGEEFREAFSCFVFSKEEPKGVDCIEKFKGMQTCFQKYPEIYGAPPSDDEDEEEIDRKLAEMDQEKAEASPSKPSSEEPPKPSSETSPSSATPKPSQPSEPTPTSSIPHSPPQSRGTDEYSHPAPKDNAEPKTGTLEHPGPGEKGLGGGSHEGPVDTDANSTGIVRPAPGNAGLENIGGHGTPGLKGVSDPNGPQI
ncbi:Oxidoreductase [Orbilia oligospora]|uniref:Mitochondrial intermembrane space import and assembly protein 40 n=1 Tax=Orbilia oligospora TaxID=2813651 RepID=A0A7C8N5Q4_ORBOL|nr:Oxidoreductase [Orbilia oligospora]KAF3111116.1 Oxidoreductase [Orbilia oligospora]KAF3115610.1 Oxidoreductase [Orbilia oligospora]KAF3119491.1 Oxidoreductase [Orbilia oligospora]KAF3128540.1 Oxidoreductase [Orbilia oligospora]